MSEFQPKVPTRRKVQKKDESNDNNDMDDKSVKPKIKVKKEKQEMVASGPFALGPAKGFCNSSLESKKPRSESIIIEKSVAVAEESQDSSLKDTLSESELEGEWAPYQVKSKTLSQDEESQERFALGLKHGHEDGKLIFLQFPSVLPIINDIDCEDQSLIQSGKAGKLNVYKSGRITIKMGQVEFDVNRCPPSNVAQYIASLDKENLSLSLLDECVERMVCTPNIDSLFGDFNK